MDALPAPTDAVGTLFLMKAISIPRRDEDLIYDLGTIYENACVCSYKPWQPLEAPFRCRRASHFLHFLEPEVDATSCIVDFCFLMPGDYGRYCPLHF